jgi:hypothetical protein
MQLLFCPNPSVVLSTSDTPAAAAQAEPKATDFIPAMVATITKIIDNGHAYALPDGDVYFDVASLPGYGRLSGRSQVQQGWHQICCRSGSTSATLGLALSDVPVHGSGPHQQDAACTANTHAYTSCSGHTDTIPGGEATNDSNRCMPGSNATHTQQR